MVIANEIIGFLRAATRGVPVNDETLALDVIDELGPTGSYLQHPHTLRHYKEPFYSDLMDKGPYAQWERKGKLSLEDRAAQVVDKILDTHHPTPLPEDVHRQLQEILHREQEWIDSRRKR